MYLLYMMTVPLSAIQMTARKAQGLSGVSVGPAAGCRPMQSAMLQAANVTNIIHGLEALLLWHTDAIYVLEASRTCDCTTKR